MQRTLRITGLLLFCLVLTARSGMAQIFTLKPTYCYIYDFIGDAPVKDYKFRSIGNFTTPITINVGRNSIECLDASFASSGRITYISTSNYGHTYHMSTLPKRSMDIIKENWELQLDDRMVPVSLTKRSVAKSQNKDTTYTSYQAALPRFTFTTITTREKHMADSEYGLRIDLEKFYRSIRNKPEQPGYNEWIVRADTIVWKHFVRQGDPAPQFEKHLGIVRDESNVFSGEGQQQVVFKCVTEAEPDNVYKIFFGREKRIDPLRDIVMCVIRNPDGEQDLLICSSP